MYACSKRICVQVSERVCECVCVCVCVCVRARFYKVVSIGLYV